jgi:hypothetical protein
LDLEQVVLLDYEESELEKGLLNYIFTVKEKEKKRRPIS